VPEEVPGLVVHVQEDLFPALLLAGLGIVAFRAQFHPGLGGQLLQGLAELQSVDPLVEIYHVARGLAAEAVEEALLVVHRHGRLGLLVERAGAHEPAGHGAQVHVAADHVREHELGFYGLDGLGVHAGPAT